MNSKINYPVLTWHGKKLFLQENAHCDIPLNASYDYQAHAIDSEGLEYFVTWQQYPGFNGEDEGEACNWDEFDVIKL